MTQKAKTPVAAAIQVIKEHPEHTDEQVQEHYEHRGRHRAMADMGGGPIEGRIPLLPKENAAINALLSEYPGQSASLSRRDPEEKGPVIVQFEHDTYLVDLETGKVTKTTMEEIYG